MSLFTASSCCVSLEICSISLSRELILFIINSSLKDLFFLYFNESFIDSNFTKHPSASSTQLNSSSFSFVVSNQLWACSISLFSFRNVLPML